MRLYLVKARRVGGSTVVTCPCAVVGEYYDVSTTVSGKIVLTPVDQAVRESTANGMNAKLTDYMDETEEYEE